MGWQSKGPAGQEIVRDGSTWWRAAGLCSSTLFLLLLLEHVKQAIPSASQEGLAVSERVIIPVLLSHLTRKIMAQELVSLW